MSCGTLYICATPIGNREDISQRALRILNEVDLIAAEDTRHSRKLLDLYEVEKPLISYHEHNKHQRAGELVERLLKGESVALISDAGTPLISDPGDVLVKKAREAGIPVTSLPGPCALITALTLSGLSARRFVFEGFLPQENREKQLVLKALGEEYRTIILYEAPHRLRKTLGELQKVLGESRPLCLCRELTKIHEEAIWTTLAEALDYYAEREPRGEYVLVIQGKSLDDTSKERQAQWHSKPPEDHLADYMARGYSKKEALKVMAEDFSISRNQLYEWLMKKERSED